MMMMGDHPFFYKPEGRVFKLFYVRKQNRRILNKKQFNSRRGYTLKNMSYAEYIAIVYHHRITIIEVRLNVRT